MVWSQTSKRCTASLAHKLLGYFAWHNYDHDHDNVDDNVHDHVHVYDDERDVIYPTVLMLLFFLTQGMPNIPDFQCDWWESGPA